jgi:hypothetical protein
MKRRIEENELRACRWKEEKKESSLRDVMSIKVKVSAHLRKERDYRRISM